jgi:hypothetical protein
MGASEEKEVGQAAARFEHEIDELERRTEEVGEHIDTARQEWERKRSDSSVPGAAPDDSDQSGEGSEA